MSTLKELVDEVDTIDVDRELRAAYPKLEEGDVQAHIRVMRLLRELPPEPHGETDDDPIERIELRRRGSGWYDVSGVSRSGTHWAIEFTRWERWLTWPVVPVKCDLTPAQMLAHCLYEMTFCGFAQFDVQERFNQINELVGEVKEELGLEFVEPRPRKLV